MKDILEFQGEHRWLSNFWPVNVMLDGVIYPSVENAYQAAKSHPSQRAPFRNCTAGAAKKIGRAAGARPGWETEKVSTMRTLIADKFSPNTALAAKLIATWPAEIVEGNAWGDTFWGVCKGVGENNLGKLLMARRAVLRGTP